MRNMSNKFYNYLSDKIKNFFEKSEIRHGDKFFIQFDEEYRVDDFYNTLKKDLDNVEEFKYQHESSNIPFTTFTTLLKNNIKVVVVNSNKVSVDYLVTLRNQVTTQEDVWKNTALLLICYDIIDSIYDGMRNLEKEDIPLNINIIKDNLKDEIDSSKDLSKVDKVVTKFYLDKKIEDSFQTTLWDYEDILAIINKGEIEENDYKNLGIFPDSALETYKSQKSKENRLEENAEHFNYVSLCNQYDNTKEELEKRYDSTGVNLLTKPDWPTVDFNKIFASRERFLNYTKTLNYKENLNKFTNEGCIYWEKPLKPTTAGRRKRQIIIFNEDNKTDEVTLKFSFDARLDRKFIVNDPSVNFSISNNSLKVNFNLVNNEPTFKKIKYTHHNQAKSTYEFNILVLPSKEDILLPIKDKYQINNKLNKIVVIDDNSEEISFGFGPNIQSYSINQDNEVINIYDEDTIKIANDSAINESGVINFSLVYNGLRIPIQIKEDSTKSRPVESLTIWKYKREFQENFIYKNNKAVQGTNSFYLHEDFKKYLKMEKQIINESIAYGECKISGDIKKIELDISDDLQNAFDRIIEYYQNIDNVPSLVFLDNDLKLLYEEFIEQFNYEIESIEKDAILSNDERKLNLIKLGTLKDNENILFTPLSPLNIAYQLEITNQCQNEILDKPILERLSPNNLLPYLYGDSENHEKELLYKPTYQKDAHEWLVFEKSVDVSINSTNAFIANVVKDKMNQFVSYFKYLFDKKSKSPIKLNIININEDTEIVRGIFNFVRDRLDDRKIKHTIPVEVNLYNDNMRSAFDDFFDCINPNQLNEKFGITIKSRVKDPMDILREVQDNITYFKHNSADNDVEYAHISFYKVGYEATIADDNMNQIETGLSIDGLLSSITSFTRTEYRTGFGTNHVLNEDNLLVQTVINLNELSLNYQNNGENTYKKRKTIITKPMELKKDLTEVLYKKSRWVTFIEPSFGLEYFENEGDGSLIIIHYSDQYSSSTKYDTITVTSKSKQYKNVMEEFLSTKINSEDKHLITDEKLDDVIKLFNSINGEWLLKIITTSGNADREKLSIISAIKYMLGILDNDDIIWIPISMEEILRIAGTVKLSKKEGIFDPKILDGKYCDDLLFIGINPNRKVEVYYYPIEVKIGINNQSVIKKGGEQIEKTYNLLKKQLFNNLNQDTQFRNKFYRNFFMQVALTNEQKLILNDLFDQEEIDKIDSLKSKLLNDDYELSNNLEHYIGKGAIISFKQDNSFRTLKKENDNLIVELNEDDAYYGLLKSFKEITDDIQSEQSEMSSTYLLSRIDINEEENVPLEDGKPDSVTPESEDVDSEGGDKPEGSAPESEDVDSEGGDKPEGSTPESNGGISNPSDSDDEKETGKESNGSVNDVDLNDTRALIGTAEGSKHEIYWEFGNPKLGNRHLLIQGKSGQGKTYFIQRLIMELSKQKVPVIIIDYTDGFRPDKLENEFVNVLGENLVHHIVIKDKFPLNPFKKYQNALFDGLSIEEDNVDVATRFVSIIGSVYNQLGIQQRNAIYQAVLTGLDKKEVMDLKDLEQELFNQDNAVASNALSQLKVFIDKNPFDSINDFDWSDINYPSSVVTVIQLTGINKDIQKIITEMILWDLWYYKTSNGGDEKQPFAVILDECQNLSFGNDSPCTKILQEGRKFGWSGWFATQFLKGKLDNNAINMLQNSEEQIYFNPPDNSVETIAKTLTKDSADKKYWESKLSSLKKGQCIVYGPTVENNELKSSKPIVVDVSPLSKE